MTPHEVQCALEKLLLDRGLGREAALQPMPGGGNNRVYRVETPGGPFFLKAYFRNPGDLRDRLTAEFSLARFAWGRGIRRVPQPLAMDSEHGLGLYEFIGGRKPAPAEVDAQAVDQALAFYQELNSQRDCPEARALPDGAEAWFRLVDHLDCVERRLQALAQMCPVTEVDHQAYALVRSAVLPAWQTTRSSVSREARQLGLDEARLLDASERCLSPSDFGFHNSLRQPDGTLRFFDFEYAGWDDPAKLVCDFFCTPALPVPLVHLPRFAAEVTKPIARSDNARARIRLLLPVYRLKWVTILLNEFLPVGLHRRRFAEPGFDLEQRKFWQLTKAKRAISDLGAVPERLTEG